MTVTETAPTLDGILADTWTSADGIAFSEMLPGGRDFTNTIWTWRDPVASLVPLYLQTENEPGHAGAELAGFIERFTLDSMGTVGASGRFYDTPVGRLARDLLLGGRVFGVSVDPTEDVQAEMICDVEDADGFCVEGRVVFSAYEIGGLTMTPFQGFDRAAIKLEGAQSVTATAGGSFVPPEHHMTVPLPARWYDELLPPLDPRVASVTVPEIPPAEWFDDPHFEQPTALTIDDDGHIYGHLALWETCHLGFPGCETPFHDPDYALFNLGAVRTDDGDRSVGRVTMNTGHASTKRGVGMAEALAHYDNTGTQAALVHAGEDAHGIWLNGVIDEQLSPENIRRLRASPLSADWRPVAGQMRLVHALAVNLPGYAIPRVAAGYDGGALVAAIFTSDMADCGCDGSHEDSLVIQRLARLEATVAALGLSEQAADALGASLTP